jgi:hypothetical protein
MPRPVVRVINITPNEDSISTDVLKNQLAKMLFYCIGLEFDRAAVNIVGSSIIQRFSTYSFIGLFQGTIPASPSSLILGLFHDGFSAV